MLRNYPSIIQEGSSDCGAACLSMIIQAYNGSYNMENLRELSKTNREGTTAYHLVKAAKEIGFNAWTVKANLRNLKDKHFPCIAHLTLSNGYSHFVVINKRLSKRLIVSDPAIGIRTISISEFEKTSSGNFILFHLEKKLAKEVNTNVILRKILSFIVNNKFSIIMIFIISLIYTILNIFSSYRIQLLIEHAIDNFSNANLLLLILIFTLAALFKIISDSLRFSLVNFLKHKLDYLLTIDVYQQIIKLPYLYYKNRSSGEIISRLQELGEIKESLTSLFIGLSIDLILVIFALIMLFSISVYLSIFLIFVAAVFIVISLIFKPINEYYIKSTKEKTALLNSFLYESIASVDTVKGLHKEYVFEEEFERHYLALIKTNYKMNKLYNKENTIRTIIFDLSILIVLFLSINSIYQNQLSLAQMISYSSLLIYFLEPIKSIIDINLSWKSTVISLNRLASIFSIKAENFSANKYLKIKDYFIKFNKLSFSYNDVDKILKNINLEIAEAERILIMGKSGSGKSTLFKLLMRYFEVENEKIFIGPYDINEYSLEQIRQAIVYVSQNEMIYNDSLYNNVTLGKDINYEEFLEIAKLSKIDELRKGLTYNIRIEENGFNLSGGERQRIMIARALISKAKIIIFDESLSQMDKDLERDILSGIFKRFQDTTFIIISHRKLNLGLFDKTYKIDEGVLKSGLE